MFKDWTEDELEDFYDRVAIIETTEIIKTIAVQGETREQTEEFLKNYRAAEAANKQR